LAAGLDFALLTSRPTRSCAWAELPPHIQETGREPPTPRRS
jgi:hypothetical protein